MTYVLGRGSLSKLTGVHPDLVRVVKRAIEITPVDFTVLEGVRTVAQQKDNVAKGVSTTMRSRHLTGHAVDLAPLANGKVSWEWDLYHKLAPAVKQAAKELNVPIEWGGDWKTFKDGPHWQLPWAKYPA
jgi:peptidoglycan L-alanyl-D-glutamate endopeptidase CwlK